MSFTLIRNVNRSFLTSKRFWAWACGSFFLLFAVSAFASVSLGISDVDLWEPFQPFFVGTSKVWTAFEAIFFIGGLWHWKKSHSPVGFGACLVAIVAIHLFVSKVIEPSSSNNQTNQSSQITSSDK